MPMTNKYSMRGSLRPPLGKPRTSKSPDIPAVYHSQTASPDGVADTDTIEECLFPGVGQLPLAAFLAIEQAFPDEILSGPM